MKADINHVTKDGATALFVAAQTGQGEIVEQLLEEKANINYANENGLTTLFIAADAGRGEIVEQLLKKKADINYATKNSATALYVAAQNGHIEVIKILLKSKEIKYEVSTQASVDILIATAKRKDREAAVKALFLMKGIINQKTLANFSPLHAAVFFGHFAAVEALLLKGASPNAVTENNISALEFAKAMGYTTIYDLLKKPIAEQKKSISRKRKLLLQNQFFLREEKEAKNDPDYMFLKTHLSQIEKTFNPEGTNKSEIALLKEIIDVYEGSKGELPINECLEIVVKNDKTYQTIAKNSDIFKEIRKTANEKKGLS
jgi:ankyrin repeat protein